MKSIFLKFPLALALVCGLSGTSRAQVNAVAMAHADSSRFSPNSQGGWQLLNSFVASVNTGNAQLELIVQNNNPVNWGRLQLLGTIKGAMLIPSKPVSVTFNILRNQYQVNINSDGRCYVKLLNGSPPSASPAVIPLRVVYKL